MAFSRFSFLVFFLVVFLATRAHEPFATAKNTDSLLFRRKLGFNKAEFEEFRRRSLNAGYDRVAPGGPDPQHHSLSPAN
ncbi:hypothetical protein ACS0TY_017648 [Phlomoides rotata]